MQLRITNRAQHVGEGDLDVLNYLNHPGLADLDGDLSNLILKCGMTHHLEQVVIDIGEASFHSRSGWLRFKRIYNL